MPVDTGGNVYALSQGPTIGLQDQLTNPGFGLTFSNAGQSADGNMVVTSVNNTATANPPYLAYIGAFFLFLIALHFLQKQKFTDIKGEHVGVNVHNLLAVGVLATFWIIVMKIIVNKYLSNVKGVSDLVNLT